MGTYNSVTDTWAQTDAAIRDLCSSHGFQYDAVTNVASTTLLINGAEEPSNCPCDCPIPPSFDDPNAEVTIFATQDQVPVPLTTVKYCCKDGYEFVPNDAAQDTFHYVITDSTGTPDRDPCLSECVELTCEDEFTTDDAHTQNFWNRQAAGANHRRTWKHNGLVKTSHSTQNAKGALVGVPLAGFCRLRKCPVPTIPIGLNVIDQGQSQEDYFVTAGQNSFTYSCANGFRGDVTFTCEMRDLSLRTDKCSPEWKITGTCTAKSCTQPASIPHGRTLIKTNQASIPVLHTTGTNVGVGQFATYRCDAGYALTFTHDDSPANEDQCLRQCHVPVEEDCGGATTINYSRIEDIAVFDPLQCYCKLIPCEKLTEAEVGSSHVLVDESELTKTHYPIAGFDTVDVKCKAPKFSSVRGGGSEPIQCSPNLVWSSPSTCIELGCPNPRTASEFYFNTEKNLAHTCSSEDTINLNPGADGSDFLNIKQSLADNSNSIIWADENQLSFKYPGDTEFLFTTQKTGSTANVVDGAVARFTCKKGFHPYYNVDAAMSGLNFDKLTGTAIECVCISGKWFCDKHCACEGLCDAV